MTSDIVPLSFYHRNEFPKKHPMKVAFLDRDGTLIREPPETKHVTMTTLQILPGIIDALKSLQDQGFALVVVSNQASAATEEIRVRDFLATQRILEEELAMEDIHFTAVFLCPHIEEQHCPCRKPKTGLVDAFLKTHEIDRDQSFMVGDRATDGEFAKNIGVRFYFMESNGEFPNITAHTQSPPN